MIKRIEKTEKIIEQPRTAWITSDGVEFDCEETAKFHEKYYCQMKLRNFPLTDSLILELNNKEELKEFIKDHYYNDTILKFDINSFKFPCVMVFEETPIVEDNNGEDDIWFRETSELYVYSLEKYKNKVINEIKQFNLD